MFTVTQLGPNVYVSAGVRIAAGARVRESIILDRAELKVGQPSYVSLINYMLTL